MIKTDYRVGERLPAEHELMERFQVGRSCLREAMRGLAMLDLVSIQPGRGTFVRSTDCPRLQSSSLEIEIGKEALSELFEARLIMEVEAAALAAERLTEKNIADFRKVVTRLESSTGDDICLFSLKIHQIMAEATQNQVIMEILGLIGKRLWAHQRNFYTEELKFQEIDSHKLLVKELLSRDPTRARTAMITHLHSTLDSMLGGGSAVSEEK